MTLPFIKMHGLGNDFVVLDARQSPLSLNRESAARIANRRLGVGCDQLVVIEKASDPAATVFMRIFNADGSESGACGNATRCVAQLVMEETGADHATIETVAGLLSSRRGARGTITVDMGPPRFGWQEIPLANAVKDTHHLPVALDDLADPVGVSMGNPHCVFFVPNAEAVAIERLGPLVEHHRLFPERTNVEVVSVEAPDRMRMRVWERGVGLTLACGSGACAVMAAAHARGLVGARATVVADGGSLDMEITAEGHVLMTGPAALSFRGELFEDTLLAA